jgi:hypothetical protein
MVYRIDHAKELPCAPVVSQSREGHGRPDGRVSVLAAVFSYSGNVAFDVAGIQIRRVERRIQQLNQSMLAANEVPIQRLHGQTGATGIARPRKHRPALRNGIDRHSGLPADPSGVPSSK